MALSGIKNFVQFLKEVKLELSKIVWPGFNEFIGSTLIVLIVICFFSIYLGLVDFGFASLMKQVFIVYG